MSQQTRSRIRRSLLLTAPIAAGALILSGCSGSSSSDSSAEQQFSLTLGVTSSAPNAYETLAKEYMEQFPDVKITINNLPSDSYSQIVPTQLNSGNAGDVIQTNPGGGEAIGVLTLAKAGQLAPLDSTSGGLVPPGSAGLFQVDGKTYGQSLSFSFIGTVFNETAAKDAGGIQYPTDSSSLEQACKAATAAGKSVFAVAGSVPPNNGLMAQIISSTRVYAANPNWNKDRADGKTTFAGTEGWKQTLETIVDMNKAGCFQPGVAGAGFDVLTGNIIGGKSLGGFLPGDAAGQFTGMSEGKATITAHSFPADSASGKPYGIGEPAYALSITKNSKNAVAAQKFLDWLAEPAQVQKYAAEQGNLPVTGLNDLDLSKTPYAAVADIIKNGDFTPQPIDTWPNSSVYDALSTGVQGLLTGQKTVDQVLESMDAAWGK